MRIAFAAALLVAASSAPAMAQDAGADRWWAHVRTLADDRFEGRLTGTPGYDRAAAYVAAEFRALGLKPAGSDGFLQPVPLIEQTIDQSRSKVSIGGRPVPVGTTLLLGSRVSQLPAVSAPLVFLGYGLHLPESGYDDFAGMDLKGKIVVIIGGGPKSLSSAVKAHARSAEFWPALERAGAVGVLSLPNPKSMDIPWSRQILLGRAPGMFLADPKLRDQTRRHFTASMNPAEAEMLFEGTGRTFAQMLAIADKAEALPRFDLGKRLEASVSASERPLSSPNVVAMLPGSDPALAGQHVVLTAHLDHIGIGEPVGGDRIYNGAMDNASGIASLIESARILAASPPRRPVIFLAVTAEERGLLGSRYYANRPTVPAASLAANVNMDMFLPIYPFTHVVAFGADQSNLGAVADAAARAANVVPAPDPEPDRNLFVRSDQYSFVRTGVPALSLKFLAATPEAKALEKDFLTNRYHAPADDLSQPIDLAAAARFNRYLADLIRRVADMDGRAQWNADSFFRRFAPAGASAAAGSGQR